MSEKIVQLNEVIIKRLLKKLEHDSIEKTLNVILNEGRYLNLRRLPDVHCLLWRPAVI